MGLIFTSERKYETLSQNMSLTLVIHFGGRGSITGFARDSKSNTDEVFNVQEWSRGVRIMCVGHDCPCDP